MNKKITIIGGIPQPIGGVTTFIKRLLSTKSSEIESMYDIYISKDKELPPNFDGFYCNLTLYQFIFHYFFSSRLRNTDLFFNFSTTESLLFFVFLPKFNRKWRIMLHHGDLRKAYSKILEKRILSKFDVIYYLSKNQYNYYSNYCNPSVLKSSSSYLPPTKNEELVRQNFKEEITQKTRGFKKVFIASGYSTSIYNHDWLIEFFSKNPDNVLLIFIYGFNKKQDEIINASANYNNIHIFININETEFNYALTQGFCYLRPTERDSFGIAVADSLLYNKQVIASDVCQRFQGSILFKTGNKTDFFEKLTQLINDEPIQTKHIENRQTMYFNF